MLLKPNLKTVLKLQNNPTLNHKPRILQGLAKSMSRSMLPSLPPMKFEELENEEPVKLECDAADSEADLWSSESKECKKNTNNRSACNTTNR